MKKDDCVKVEISCQQTQLSYSMEQSGSHMLKVTFTVQQAGPYVIAILVTGKHIRGSPFKKTFNPGI